MPSLRKLRPLDAEAARLDGFSEGVGGFVERLAASRGVDAETVERESFATARPSSILQRFATPHEVVAVIAYLCSA